MIRKFIAEDAVACCNLIHVCIEMDRSIPAVLRGRMLRAETPESMLERSRLFYTAVHESDSRISGITGLDMNEIRILCVSPGRRREGIGSALIEHLVDMVPPALFPDTFVYASTGAVPFYKTAGFVEKGPMAFVFAGSRLQTVFMARPVQDTDTPRRR